MHISILKEASEITDNRTINEDSVVLIALKGWLRVFLLFWMQVKIENVREPQPYPPTAEMLLLTDITVLLIALLASILFCVIGVLFTCYCCCRYPLSYLFKSMRKRENPSSNYNYELPTAYNKGLNSNSMEYQHVEPSAPPMSLMDNEVVEAFLVSPLVAVYEKYDEEIMPYSNNNILVSPLSHCDEIITPTNTNKVHSQSKFQDVWAAVLFFINVTGLLYFAIKSANIISMEGFTLNDNLSNMRPLWSTFGIMSYFVLGFTILAFLISYAVLLFLLKYSGSLIDLVLKANILLLFVSSVISFLTLNLIGGVILTICGFMNIWYYISVKDRIPFASAVLSTACEGTKDHFIGVITTAVLMLVLQLLWVGLWSIATVGIMGDTQYFSRHKHSDNSGNNDDNSLDSLQIGLIFLVILSLYWGIQTIKYVLQTTVAGEYYVRSPFTHKLPIIFQCVSCLCCAKFCTSFCAFVWRHPIPHQMLIEIWYEFKLIWNHTNCFLFLDSMLTVFEL